MPLGPLGVISMTFQMLTLQSSLSHIQIVFTKTRNVISKCMQCLDAGQGCLGQIVITLLLIP